MPAISPVASATPKRQSLQNLTAQHLQEIQELALKNTELKHSGGTFKMVNVVKEQLSTIGIATRSNTLHTLFKELSEKQIRPAYIYTFIVNDSILKKNFESKFGEVAAQSEENIINCFKELDSQNQNQN